MEFGIKENPDVSDINEIRYPLQKHNAPYWEVDHKDKYILTLKDNNILLGGIVFTIFGEWVEIDFFWIDAKNRNKGHGKALLKKQKIFAFPKDAKWHIRILSIFRQNHFMKKMDTK
jgi:predicted acetyltransferase